MRSLGVTSAVFLTMAGCVSPSNLIGQTEYSHKGERTSVIIGIEGLGGGYLMHNLVARVAEESGIKQRASAGDYRSHLDVIEEVHKQGGQIYLAGFSSGANEVRLLTEFCKNRSIPVARVFMLDPTYAARPFPGRIPKGVEKVVCYRSDASFIFAGNLDKSNVEDENCELKHMRVKCGHVSLPQQEGLIEDIVAEVKSREGNMVYLASQ